MLLLRPLIFLLCLTAAGVLAANRPSVRHRRHRPHEHDDSCILPKLRIYFIGGPNKMWSVNAFNFIGKNHPKVWMELLAIRRSPAGAASSRTSGMAASKPPRGARAIACPPPLASRRSAIALLATGA